jgi:signal transduction histidine kinase
MQSCRGADGVSRVNEVSRLPARFAVAISVWLVVVPAILLGVRLALPSDDVGTVPPGETIAGGGLELAPFGSSVGVPAGSVLRAVNGVPIQDVLTSPTKRPVAVGRRLVYTVEHDGTTRDVSVKVRSHPDLVGLVESQQPDLALVAVAMLVLAGWLLRRRPREPAVQAFLLFAAGWFSSALSALAWSSVLDFWARPWFVVWADVGLGGYLASGIATLLFALAFPVAPAWFARGWWPAPALVPVAMCLGLGAWVARHGTRAADFALVNGVAEVLWQACTLATLVVIAVRYVRLRGNLEARRRIQIVVLGLVATLAITLIGKWLSVPAGTFGFGLVVLLFPLSVAVALTRRDLYELDLVLNRSLVALVSGTALLAIYLTLAGLTAQLTRNDGPLVALPAAGVVAVAFAPIRTRVQALVSRRLFGSADDPQLVLHRLGVRLEASANPESLVAAVVDTAAETLRLSYAAVELVTDGDWRTVHERGRRPADVDTFDITVGDHVVGRLVAAPRRDIPALSPQDRRTLTDLARHSGVAAHVVALLTDLRVAQQRLLVAREEERHRIHRDLHDSVGPSLVGLTLQLDVAAELAQDSELAELTRRLHGEAARATDEVRRMVRDLRPGELEELGLTAAVSAAAARLSSPHAPRFDIDTPTSLPELSAEVEDAAYKICLEAMTNVIRHSGATLCRVRIGHTADVLELEIRDDGHGLASGAAAGTGLDSMRDRAIGVGGDLSVSANGEAGAGTVVQAQLPTVRS